MADEDQDDSQKTEDATPKKLEEARKKGQVPMSKEVGTWLMLLTGTLIVANIGPHMAEDIAAISRNVIEQSWQVSAENGLLAIMGTLVRDVIGIMILPLLIFFIMAIAGPLLQIGPLFAPEVIKPKLDKISPLAGVKRLFSMRSLVEFIKGLIKISLITGAVYIVLRPYEDQLERLITLPIEETAIEILRLFVKLMTAILSVIFVLAAMDVVYQRLSHLKQMRMSRQDVRDEYKQSEGDPHVRAKLRQMRMERSQKRMMQRVPEATVVITNPTHFAVALLYDPEKMDAPQCIAKGQDLIALRIRALAEENDVTIVENPPLARTLFAAVEVDDTVPAEHFKAVAEVISYVFRLKKRM